MTDKQLKTICDKLDTLIELMKPTECNCEEEETLERKYANLMVPHSLAEEPNKHYG